VLADAADAGIRGAGIVIIAILWERDARTADTGVSGAGNAIAGANHRGEHAIAVAGIAGIVGTTDIIIAVNRRVNA